MGLFSLVLSGVSFLLFIVCSLSYTLEYKFFASETNWGYVNQRSTEWNKNELHEEDVLFFGSSTCYSGIDPSALNAFGLSGFNFCSSSQAIGNSASLIPAASMDVSPECIALDVYPWIWGTTTPALESTKDWIINSNLRTPAWSKAYRTLALESGDIFHHFHNILLRFRAPIQSGRKQSHLAERSEGRLPRTGICCAFI